MASTELLLQLFDLLGHHEIKCSCRFELLLELVFRELAIYFGSIPDLLRGIPNLSVEIVSFRLRFEGEQANMNVVTEFPPMDSWGTLVSRDFR